MGIIKISKIETGCRIKNNFLLFINLGRNLKSGKVIELGILFSGFKKIKKCGKKIMLITVDVESMIIIVNARSFEPGIRLLKKIKGQRQIIDVRREIIIAGKSFLFFNLKTEGLGELVKFSIIRRQVSEINPRESVKPKIDF